MSISAIVVAAGRGSRMGSANDKAFLPLAGQPIVLYSLQTLQRLPGLLSIVLVIGEGREGAATALLDRFGPWPVPVQLTRGGAERQDSVAAGLQRVNATSELVIVHDAARPFASLACLTACVEAAQTTGAAIAAVPVQDTVKMVDGDVITQTPDRRRIWLAQTPQVFRTSLLREAHQRARQEGFHGTDDAALVERLGARVRIVAGESSNRKITTPDDLRWAEWHLQSQTE